MIKKPSLTFQAIRLQDTSVRNMERNCTCEMTEHRTNRPESIQSVRPAPGLPWQCPIHRSKSDWQFTSMWTFRSRMLARALYLAFICSNEGGWPWISASLWVARIVDPEGSPAFKCIKQTSSLIGEMVFQRHWGRGYDHSSVVPAVQESLQDLYKDLINAFRQGDSSPHDQTVDGRTLLNVSRQDQTTRSANADNHSCHIWPINFSRRTKLKQLSRNSPN